MKQSTVHVIYYKLMQTEKCKNRVSSGELGAFITPIDITADKINRTIGFDLSQNDIVTIFNDLGFDTEINDGN